VSVALISSDKVVVALAFGIPVVLGVLVILWSRPRRWAPLWALLSVVLVVATAAGAWAAFQAEPPAPTPAAIPTTQAPSPPPPPPAPPPSPSPSLSPTPSPSPSSSAACSPDGTELDLAAAGIAFDTDCLAAPADTAFTIAFDNQDAGTPHNVHIFSADPAQDPNAESLFTGDLVTGPETVTYQVSALPAGTYYFHCDVHPTQMFGTFVSG
jgi:plastocyanin